MRKGRNNMPKLVGAVMSIKNQTGDYVSLYPQTIQSQVNDFNKLGETFGPYILELNSANWVNNQQTLDLTDILSSDIPYCVKILEGTQEQMQAQQDAYNLLNPLTGVESLDGQIRFTTTSTPITTFKVQIHWFR